MPISVDLYSYDIGIGHLHCLVSQMIIIIIIFIIDVIYLGLFIIKITLKMLKSRHWAGQWSSTEAGASRSHDDDNNDDHPQKHLSFQTLI